MHAARKGIYTRDFVEATLIFTISAGDELLVLADVIFDELEACFKHHVNTLCRDLDPARFYRVFKIDENNGGKSQLCKPEEVDNLTEVQLKALSYEFTLYWALNQLPIDLCTQETSNQISKLLASKVQYLLQMNVMWISEPALV